MPRRFSVCTLAVSVAAVSSVAFAQSPLKLWEDVAAFHSVSRGPVVSPDKKWVAIGNSDEINVRDADSLKFKFLVNSPDYILWITITSDSKSLVVGRDVAGVDRASIYDLATGNQTADFLIPEDTVDAIPGYTAPGGYPTFVMRSATSVQVVGYNGAGWNTLGSFAGFGNIDSFAVSRNGKYLAVGDSGADFLTAYSLDTFNPTPVASKLANNPYAIAFSPNSSQLVVAHGSGLVRFWNVAGWVSPGEFTLPSTTPLTIEYTSNGASVWVGYANSVEKRNLAGTIQVAAVGSDSTPDYMGLNRFDRPIFDGLDELRFLDSTNQLRIGPGHKSYITDIAVAPSNGWIVSAADFDDPSVRQWNPTGGTQFRTWTPNGSSITHLGVTNDSQKIVVASTSNITTILIYNALGTLLNLNPIGQTNNVSALAVSPAIAGLGYLAAYSDGSSVRLLKVSDPNFGVQPTITHTSAVSAIVFNRNGSRLAVGHNDGTVRVYKPQAGSWVLVKSVVVTATPTKLEFDQSGNFILVGTDDGSMGLLRIVKSTVAGETWAVNDTITLPGNESVRTLAVSRDGRTVAVSTNSFVHFYYVSTMQRLSTWTDWAGNLDAIQYGATNETIYLGAWGWLRCVKNPYPAFVNTVTVSPGSVPKGQSATLTVHLTSRAPAGGLIITLTDYTTSVNTPATVTVPAGATSASTTLTTSAGSVAGTYSITARLFGKGANGTLTIMP